MPESPANSRFAWFLYGVAVVGAVFALHSNFRTNSERARIDELERELAAHYVGVLTAPMSGGCCAERDRLREDRQKVCLLVNALKAGIGHQMPECADALKEAVREALDSTPDPFARQHPTPR